MQALKVALAVAVVQFLPGMGDAVHAQTSAGSFGVTILLHTFSEAERASTLKGCPALGVRNKSPSDLAIHCR